MMKTLSAGAALLLAACATPPPSGPGILVLPGTGKNFDQFRFDDQDCRGFAHSQIGGKAAEQATTDAAAKSALLGTVIGAAAGGGQGHDHTSTSSTCTPSRPVARPREIAPTVSCLPQA